MKNIDFLPGWYRNSRRKEVGLRGQYIIIGTMLAFMVFWSFITGGSVSRAQARISKHQHLEDQAEITLKEAKKLQQQVEQLDKKAYLLSEIDSGLDIPNILSEISFLISRNIVLNEVAFNAQKPQEEQKKKTQPASIRVAGKELSKDGIAMLGNVQFKITIKGIASDTSDVGELVHKLEQSEYFCSVSLLFSRNKKINTGIKNNKQEKQVSEFEISCYLANFSVGS